MLLDDITVAVVIRFVLIPYDFKVSVNNNIYEAAEDLHDNI
jgi:replicative DNA helicase